MRYDYVLRFDDFQNSQRLYLRHRRSAALVYYGYVWLLPIAGILAFAMFIATLLGFHPELRAAFAGFGAAGLWFAIFIPIMQFFGRRRCWKRMLPVGIKGKTTKAEIPVNLEFNNEQLISVLPGKSEGRFYWPAIVDFAEDERIALVFVNNKKKFLLIPKRALPAEAWDELRSLMANRTEAA